MKICLISPDSPGLIDPKVFPPLGILYLSAVLKQAGHEVEVLDFAGEGPLELPLFDQDPDVVGITATTPQFPIAVHILKYLQDKNINTIIGGPHATVDPQSCRDAGFFVWRGECAGTHDNPYSITDLLDKDINGDCIDNVGNLDSIPFPDRDAIDIKSYKYKLDDRDCTSIITSRGCPYNCAFCSKTWGKKVRYRSTRNVINEAAMLKNKYSYNALMFYDDEMLINQKRDWDIFNTLRKMNMTFRFFSRINLIKERMPENLELMGCKQICFGIESGSDKILKDINKGFTIKQAKQVIGWCKKAGLSVKVFMIVGLPGESVESLHETTGFLEETRPDDVDFTVLTVYPGSDIYNNPDKYDLKWKPGSDWYKTTPGKYTTGVSTSKLTSEEIINARDLLEERFKKW